MNTNNLNNQKAKNLQENFALSTTGCISALCKDKPLMVIQTKCGVGKYQFKRIGESEGKLYIEFKLIHDEDFKDCEKISHYLGDFCYLSTQQYLYAYKYFANS
tara:strand:- start:7397 stop:7705 length:309 start_codon:yes stop_codon:yes gene_type:complete